MMKIRNNTLRGKEKRIFRTIAHRGDVTNGPENTIAGFNTSETTDVDVFRRWVEADFRKTSDGHWVLMHDTTVNRTTDGSGNISTLTLTQVKELDAGSWYDPAFSEEKVPTMTEFFEHCADKKLTVWFDLKLNVNTNDCENIISEWLGAGNRLLNLIFFVSQNTFGDSLPPAHTMRSVNTEVPIGVFSNPSVGLSTLSTMLMNIGGPVFVSLNKNNPIVTTENIETLRGIAKRVYIHTIENSTDLSNALAAKPDGVLSDIIS